MKNIILIFFCIFIISCLCYANEYNKIKIGTTLFLPFEITNSSNFYIYNICIWDSISYSIFYLMEFSHYYINFEYEVVFDLDLLKNYEYSITLFMFFKVGSGLIFGIGPLIFKMLINISPGFYLIKEKYYDLFDEKWYNYEYYDYYICFEPNFIIGYKIDDKFSFNIGVRFKYFIFFNYQYPEFKPYYVYTMFVYSI